MQVMLDGYYPRRLHVCIEGINFARFIAFYVAFISPQHYLYISGWQSRRNKIARSRTINDISIYTRISRYNSHVTYFVFLIPEEFSNSNHRRSSRMPRVSAKRNPAKEARAIGLPIIIEKRIANARYRIPRVSRR